MNLRRFLPHIALVIGAVLFSAGLQTLAFTPPSSAPPTGDAYAPLTTSDVGQTKAAGLHLKGANSIVADGNFVYNTGDGIRWWLTGYISGIGGNGPAIMLQKNVNRGGYQNRRGSLGWMGNNGSVAEVLTWVENGNVGIGTTNPTQKLDVAGYIKGQTGLCIGSDCRTAWPAVGGGAETDPTVPASVKDGTSWGEISGIPAGFADGVDNVGGGSFRIVSTGWTNRGAPNITALCPAGFILTGGNCEWEDSDYKYSTIHSSPNGNGWKCESTDGSRRARAHAFCHQ